MAGWLKSVKNYNDPVYISSVIVFLSFFVGLFISAPPKQEKPFKAVLDTDTTVIGGFASTVHVRHQYITAMSDYADLSFEELRLQCDKYKQRGYLLHYVVAFCVC
jgi:hypothetical protein